MNTRKRSVQWRAFLALATLNIHVVSAIAQGTAFSYQGQLNQGGTPASGLYDLRFTVYDSTNSPGNVISGPITNNAIAVSNGLFWAALDFGAGVFTGPARWLQVDVRTNGTDSFTALFPRQAMLAAPYAVLASSASNLLGALPANQLTGTIQSTQLAAGAVTGADIANNTITAANIAPGIAIVPSGTIVLSSTPSNTPLSAAGFAPVANSVLGANWTEATNSAPWGVRATFGAVSLNGQLWVMGGWGGPYEAEWWYQDVWASADGQTWTLATNAASWGERSDFAALSFNGQMWVLGGTAPPSTFQSDVWSSSNGVAWIRVTNGAPWGPRLDFPAVSFNGQIWIFGGAGDGVYLNDVWSSSNGVAWTQVTSAAPWGQRYGLQAVAFNGKLWIMGGENGESYLNDVWSSSDGVTWTQATNTVPWSPRAYFGAASFNGQLWVMGGSAQPVDLYDVWSSSDGVNWTQVNRGAPWSDRDSFASLPFNGRLWVMGGEYEEGSGYLNDVWYSQSSTNFLGGFYLFQKQ